MGHYDCWSIPGNTRFDQTLSKIGLDRRQIRNAFFEFIGTTLFAFFGGFSSPASAGSGAWVNGLLLASIIYLTDGGEYSPLLCIGSHEFNFIHSSFNCLLSLGHSFSGVNIHQFRVCGSCRSHQCVCHIVRAFYEEHKAAFGAFVHHSPDRRCDHRGRYPDRPSTDHCRPTRMLQTKRCY